MAIAYLSQMPSTISRRATFEGAGMIVITAPFLLLFPSLLVFLGKRPADSVATNVREPIYEQAA